jgi:uncharacterized protein with von Willebrand factor type A (vWA) domain
MAFMDDFLSSRQVRKDPSTKYSVQSNKWDRQTKDEVEEQVKDYIIATQRLTSHVDTGYEAMSDTLLSLFKAAPKLRDPKEMRPSYLINHAVMNEMHKLKEMDEARRSSVGDPVATGLAAATLEPELEILFDKMKKAQKQAEQIEQMLQSAEAYADELESVMARMAESDSVEGEEPVDWQEQAARIEEALEQLRQQIQSGQDELQSELETQAPMIKQALEGALSEINADNEALGQFDSWGLAPGSVRRLNPKPRLELARKLRSRQFKRMAEVIGRMQSIAFTAQTQRADYAMEEVYELEQGADLARLVPTELLALNDDILVYDFLHRFAERSLTQYALQGEETVNRGGIITLMDSSSSMHGDRVCWSKAISLALLKIAKMQKRPFTAIEFAGPGEYIEFRFDTTGDELVLERRYHGSSRFSYGADAIIAFAEDGLGGGTCFMTPFGRALDLMDAEHSATGSVKADIVFLTDGQAGVSQDFLKRFKSEQERLGFQVFGIAIGGSTDSEPINTLCDGNVADFKRLVKEDDMRPIFAAVGSA